MALRVDSLHRAVKLAPAFPRRHRREGQRELATLNCAPRKPNHTLRKGCGPRPAVERAKPTLLEKGGSGQALAHHIAKILEDGGHLQQGRVPALQSQEALHTHPETEQLEIQHQEAFRA